MTGDVVFIVATVEDKGKSKDLSQINSHCAAQKYAKRRNTTLVSSAQPDDDGLLPHAQKKFVRRKTGTIQKPWLLATRPHRALYSELVPVIRWPLELTSYEKSLVHFLLDEGRRFSFSEGMTPTYSLAFDWAYRLLESTQMFPICHAVMAEAFMQQLHGRKPTKVFYARQAHAYRLMNDLLNDDTADCDEKLLGFAQVIVMELILGKKLVKRQHFRAMDEYIEMCGGLGHILAMPRTSRSALDPWRFVLYFCWAELPVPTRPRLVKLVDRFKGNLRCIREWAQEFKASNQSKDVSIMSTDIRNAVATVHEYVLWLFKESWLGDHKHYDADVGALFFIFILCLAQAEYIYDTAETLQLFTNLAPCITQGKHNDPICIFPCLHPISAMSSMAYVRDSIIHDKSKEVELCVATVDVVRVASLLSIPTMTRLIQSWISCLFQPVGHPLPDSAMESLNEDSILEMEEEIWLTWNSINCDDIKSNMHAQQTLQT